MVEHVVVHDRSGWHRVWRFTRLGLLVLLVLLVIAVAAVWIWRKPIADDYIRDELERRGRHRDLHARSRRLPHPAGQQPRHRRSANSGPHRPPGDHPAQAIKWNGSVKVYRVAARGVRLQGAGGRQQGELGPGRQAASAADRQAVHAARLRARPRRTQPSRSPRPYGPMGFAVDGRGNLSGGFKGRLAAAAPRLTPGACSLDQFRAFVDIGVIARRPQVKGPIGAVGFACPASNIRLAEPRFDIEASFSEAFGSFDGRGRLALASMEAGDQRAGGRCQQRDLQGDADADIGAGRPGRAGKPRLGDIVAERTNFDGRLSARSAARCADPARQLWREQCRACSIA